jgi:hypothetical protein
MLAVAATVPKFLNYGRHATSRKDGAPAIAVAADAAEPACPSSRTEQAQESFFMKTKKALPFGRASFI